LELTSGRENRARPTADVVQVPAQQLASSFWLLVWALKELAASNKRFNDFVSEIARLNKLFRDHS
jgi:hypothetical protein